MNTGEGRHRLSCTHPQTIPQISSDLYRHRSPAMVSNINIILSSLSFTVHQYNNQPRQTPKQDMSDSLNMFPLSLYRMHGVMSGIRALSGLFDPHAMELYSSVGFLKANSVVVKNQTNLSGNKDKEMLYLFWCSELTLAYVARPEGSVHQCMVFGFPKESRFGKGEPVCGFVPITDTYLFYDGNVVRKQLNI